MTPAFISDGTTLIVLLAGIIFIAIAAFVGAWINEPNGINEMKSVVRGIVRRIQGRG